MFLSQYSSSHQKLRFIQLWVFCSVFSEQLAVRLHEEEQRHAQSAVPATAISRDHTRPYAHAQPATVDRNKKGSVSVNAV
jgi:hypothetical protein